jgi:hypothetical protein
MPEDSAPEGPKLRHRLADADQVRARRWARALWLVTLVGLLLALAFGGLAAQRVEGVDVSWRFLSISTIVDLGLIGDGGAVSYDGRLGRSPVEAPGLPRLRILGWAALVLLCASIVLVAASTFGSARLGAALRSWTLAVHALMVGAAVLFWTSPLPDSLVADVSRKMLGDRAPRGPPGSPEPGFVLIIAAVALLPNLAAWALARRNRGVAEGPSRPRGAAA